MRRIEYHTSIQIWLSLEDYYNAGIKSERAEEIIENIRDRAMPYVNLRCERSGLNGNWIVRTFMREDNAFIVVMDIKDALERELKTLKETERR